MRRLSLCFCDQGGRGRKGGREGGREGGKGERKRERGREGEI
jgi:hypothetical protein